MGHMKMVNLSAFCLRISRAKIDGITAFGALLLSKPLTHYSILLRGKGVGEYNNANRKMFACFCKNEEPDGEIVFLAADPKCKAKGIGTALLSALETEEKGKLIYLYTDNACTYQFYEHRGFKRSEEQDIVIELNNKKVPLKCMLYSKKFDC